MPKVSQAHLDARRAQIIAAASRCLLRAGLHATTIQDIVRESGLSAGAIYSYFASKDDIIEAIADDRHTVEQRALADACGQAEFADALERLSRYFFLSLHHPDEQERRRLGVQMWAEALHDDRVLAIVRRGLDVPRKHLAALMAQAQRRGGLRADLDPDAIARALIGLYHGLILQQAWDPQTQIEPYLAVVDAMVRALVDQRPAPAKRVAD